MLHIFASYIQSLFLQANSISYVTMVSFPPCTLMRGMIGTISYCYYSCLYFEAVLLLALIQPCRLMVTLNRCFLKKFRKISSTLMRRMMSHLENRMDSRVGKVINSVAPIHHRASGKSADILPLVEGFSSSAKKTNKRKTSRSIQGSSASWRTNNPLKWD